MLIDRTIDDIDLQIVALLQSSARTSNAEVARQVGLAPSATLERLRKLEARGRVRG
jgi:Lrp/AsnC family leucine-responsive transcriptional regulator